MDDKKKIEQLEAEIRLFKEHSEVRAFFVLNKILNQQVDFLHNFNLTAHIGSEAKEDRMYERAEKMWKAMPELAEQINTLKIMFKLTGDEAKDLDRKPFNERLAQKRE